MTYILGMGCLHDNSFWSMDDGQVSGWNLTVLNLLGRVFCVLIGQSYAFEVCAAICSWNMNHALHGI